jgi:NADH-quinone oxidoreductase subunit H
VVAIQVVVFLAKVFLVCVFQVQVRWSLPRFRYDQLLRFGWLTLLPLGIVNLAATAVLAWLQGGAA